MKLLVSVSHSKGKTLIILLVMFAFVLAYLEASLAGPATSNNYYTLCIDNDCFRNWDSSSDIIINASTADWPVTLIYYRHAEVDKIKLSYGWILTGIGNKMYMYMTDDGITWFVDSDRGMKTLVIFSEP
jgi:hypothetical protein